MTTPALSASSSSLDFPDLDLGQPSQLKRKIYTLPLHPGSSRWSWGNANKNRMMSSLADPANPFPDEY
jgi:hypothetical protein